MKELRMEEAKGWLSDAKKRFSARNCAAERLAKDYMSGSAWELSDASNDVVLLYTDNKDNMINYAFIDGLHLVTVTYPNFNEKKASGIKAEIERRYGITMTKTTNPEDSSQYMLSGTATINNRTVAIMMNCYAQGINIIYGLPD